MLFSGLRNGRRRLKARHAIVLTRTFQNGFFGMVPRFGGGHTTRARPHCFDDHQFPMCDAIVTENPKLMTDSLTDQEFTVIMPT
jgi:hypothetical protein